MRNVLVRGLDDDTVERLKARASRNGRSLQAEAKLALERAAGAGPEEIDAMLDRWHERFAGRSFTPSVELIREDRER